METTVSLPKHLHANLIRLLDSEVLPEETASSLKQHVQSSYDTSSAEITYGLLRETSQWTQTDQGKEALLAKELDYRDYSMIALLAGTTTSPFAKLGSFKRAPSPESEALQRAKDRKALSALINGMLSVIGVGVAAWWAAGSVGWKPEYRALLAVFAAFFVAATEAALYWIWQWRYDTALKMHSRHKSEIPKIINQEGMELSNDIGPGTSGAESEKEEQKIRRRGRRQNRDESDLPEKIN